MSDFIVQIIEPPNKDLGGFEVRRSLPSADRPMVGPFIFFDHLGPAVFPPGRGVDVRPHPHIGLATVTYLFEGVLLHRDNLGSVQEIEPGAVNWMTAGRGVVHSERSPQADRDREARLHGIQTWVALPQEFEETQPEFSHYAASDLPAWEENGVAFKLIVGQAYGRTSPVRSFSPIVYLDVQLTPGSRFTLPDGYVDRAIYSVTEGIRLNGTLLEPHRMAILAPQSEVEVTADSEAHAMVIGGEPLGRRHRWWNFVSSRSERIEQAKLDWRMGNFEPVPQETEFIPLPEDSSQKEGVF